MEQLQQMSLFRDLTDEELSRVWNITIKRSIRKRSVLFHEGDDKEAVYFVVDGLIKAYKTDENGHEHIVSILKSGDMFPHTGFFHAHPYPATTEALVETKLLAIPIRSFEQLLVESPQIAIKVMRVLSDKVLELQQKLQALTGQDVQDRILSYLIKLAEDYGTAKGSSLHIEVPMTNQDFASAVGTSRETVNRLITQLRKEGILETSRSEIVVLDYEALKGWTSRA